MPHQTSGNQPPPFPPLRVNHTPQYVNRMKHPRIHTVIVVSPGFYSLPINGDDAVGDLAVLFAGDEGDNISTQNLFTIVRNNPSLSPGLSVGYILGPVWYI